MDAVKSLYWMVAGFAKGRLTRLWHGIDNLSAEAHEDELSEKMVNVAHTLREMGGFGAFFAINTFIPDGTKQSAPATVDEFVTRLGVNNAATNQAMRDGVYAKQPSLEEGLVYLDMAVRDLSEFWNRRDPCMDVLTNAILDKTMLHSFIMNGILPEGSRIVFSEKNFALHFSTQESGPETIVLKRPESPAPVPAAP